MPLVTGTSGPQQPAAGTRRFTLVQDTVTTVADGVEFSDGTCVLRWREAPTHTAVYAAVTDVTTDNDPARVVYVDS